MRTAIISFTAQGAKTALRLSEGLRRSPKAGNARAVRLGELGVGLDEFTRRAFQEEDGLIFVGAAGIAVRAVAPYVRDKTKDPAVVVVDELGRFAIPILSGHIGGANELARMAASILGAVPVITTATDLHQAFAVDVFASKNGLAIESMEEAKRISSAVLDGEKIGFFSDFFVEGTAPAALTPGEWQNHNVYITWSQERLPSGAQESWAGGRKLLRLFPRTACLGMGCRRGIPPEAAEAAAKAALLGSGLSRMALGALATIELKRDEAALRGLAEQWGLDFCTFSASELGRAQGTFEESEFVRRTAGVGNVCERAAVLGLRRMVEKQSDSGALLCRKTAVCGATAAIAAIPSGVRIRFDA